MCQYPPVVTPLGRPTCHPSVGKPQFPRAYLGAQSQAEQQERATGLAGSESLTLVTGYERLRAFFVQAEVDGVPNCHFSLTSQDKCTICKGIDDRKGLVICICAPGPLGFSPPRSPALSGLPLQAGAWKARGPAASQIRDLD